MASGAPGRFGRRRSLRRPVSIYVGFCLVGLWAGAERAGAAATLALGQETTLTASRSGFVELRLEQGLDLSEAEGDQPREISMKFSGTPRFAVAVLRATAADGEGRHPMVTAATQGRGATTFTPRLGPAPPGRQLPAVRVRYRL